MTIATVLKLQFCDACSQQMSQTLQGDTVHTAAEIAARVARFFRREVVTTDRKLA